MHKWSRATVIFFPLSETTLSVDPRIEGSASRWIGVGVVNPRCKSALRRIGGNPSAWNDPPPVNCLLCLLSLPLRTSAAPSARFRECCSPARDANRASSSASDSSSSAATAVAAAPLLKDVAAFVRAVLVGLRALAAVLEPRRADEMSMPPSESLLSIAGGSRCERSGGSERCSWVIETKADSL